MMRKWQKSNKETKIFGSAWSAPIWMKTNHAFNGITKLNGTPGDKIHKGIVNNSKYYYFCNLSVVIIVVISDETSYRSDN